MAVRPISSFGMHALALGYPGSRRKSRALWQELENENRSPIVRLGEQIRTGIVGNGKPSPKMAIDRLTQFNYRILGLIAAISSIGAFPTEMSNSAQTESTFNPSLAISRLPKKITTFSQSRKRRTARSV